MVEIQPAHRLIGHEGVFRLPGGRATYEAVMWIGETARSDRPRLCRIDTSTGKLRQVNRWVDWGQPIEVIEDYSAESSNA